MPGTHAPIDDIELPSAALDDRDGDEPARGDDDREHRVAHRPNPLPAREEDEEELAEADILRELDFDADDLDLDLDLDDLEPPND
jgi:hypothetical protein